MVKIAAFPIGPRATACGSPDSNHNKKENEVPTMTNEQRTAGIMELLALGHELDQDINDFERAQIQWLHDTGKKHGLSNEAISILAATAPNLQQIIQRRIALDRAVGRAAD